MFCQKCGTQIGEGADFCHICGTKVACQNTNEKTQDTAQAIIEKENVGMAALDDGNDLKKFVEGHIRATTKFRSAEDLLKRSNPQLFIWIICFAAFAILGLGAGGLLGALAFGVFFGLIAKLMAGGIIRTKCFTKTSGEFDGNINMKQLCYFLNTKLNSLYPSFHQWSCNGNRMVASFGEKKIMQRCIVSLYITEPTYIQPKDSEADGTRKMYAVDVEDKGTMLSKIVGMTIFSLLQINDPRTLCLIRTAPILQAAMMYYIKNNLKVEGE